MFSPRVFQHLEWLWGISLSELNQMDLGVGCLPRLLGIFKSAVPLNPA